MEIRLKENLGMQSTLTRIKVDNSRTIPICVNLAMSPLGSLIEICTTEVIEVKMLKNESYDQWLHCQGSNQWTEYEKYR